MNETNCLHLTHTEVCTLMAHETVSLLESADTLEAAGLCRAAMEAFCTMQELGEAGEALLLWVDMELESAKLFAAEGKDSIHLIDSDRLLKVPDAAAQLAMIWALFETAAKAECSQDARQTLLNAAHTLTEMGGLDDLILTAHQPAKALDAAALQTEQADVCAAIRKMDETEQAAVSPCEAPEAEKDAQHQADT